MEKVPIGVYLYYMKGNEPMTTIKVDKDIHKSVKLFCVAEKISMTAFANEALLNELARRKGKKEVKNNVN